MKQLILILILIILCLPFSYALYGGENWSYDFPKCDNLIVNITSDLGIDPGEYTILNDNCTEESDNYFLCDCYDHYNLTISFAVNAVNQYNILFNYDYNQYVADKPVQKRSGSSGGSGGVFTVRFRNDTAITLSLKPYVDSRFWVNGQQHTIRVINISDDNGHIGLEFRSDPLNIILYLNQSQNITIDNQTLQLTLVDIRGRISVIEFEKITGIVETEEAIVEEINNTSPVLVDQNLSVVSPLIESNHEVITEEVDGVQPNVNVTLDVGWGDAVESEGYSFGVRLIIGLFVILACFIAVWFVGKYWPQSDD